MILQVWFPEIKGQMANRKRKHRIFHLITFSVKSCDWGHSWCCEKIVGLLRKQFEFQCCLETEEVVLSAWWGHLFWGLGCSHWGKRGGPLSLQKRNGPTQPWPAVPHFSYCHTFLIDPLDFCWAASVKCLMRNKVGFIQLWLGTENIFS